MKVKTSELQGAALDWAVARCEGRGGQAYLRGGKLYEPLFEEFLCYSTNWAQGGPIIEQQGIALYLYGDYQWNAHVGGRESVGPTALIAAMRCHVVSELGDEIDVPDDLV